MHRDGAVCHDHQAGVRLVLAGEPLLQALQHSLRAGVHQPGQLAGVALSRPLLRGGAVQIRQLGCLLIGRSRLRIERPERIPVQAVERVGVRGAGAAGPVELSRGELARRQRLHRGDQAAGLVRRQDRHRALARLARQREADAQSRRADRVQLHPAP